MKEMGSDPFSEASTALGACAAESEKGSDPNSLRLKRMRWHCRRGTRELDRLLERWLEANGAIADESRLSAFEAVLACEDRDLQRWILGYYPCDRAELSALIDEIRAKPAA